VNTATHLTTQPTPARVSFPFIFVANQICLMICTLQVITANWNTVINLNLVFRLLKAGNF